MRYDVMLRYYKPETNVTVALRPAGWNPLQVQLPKEYCHIHNRSDRKGCINWETDI